jgi:hypothetical protein
MVKAEEDDEEEEKEEEGKQSIIYRCEKAWECEPFWSQWQLSFGTATL